MKRPPLSLKAQALALLARREHSRSELRGKLLAHARKRARAQAEEAAREAALGPRDPWDLPDETEPVEERLDLSLRARGAVFIVRAVGGDERCARVTQQLGAQLDAAVLALSEQLQGARLQRARRALHGLSP